MDYQKVFEISASGLDFQRMRMEAIALNIANAQNTQRVNGRLYQPLTAVAHMQAQRFESALQMPELAGVPQAELLPRDVAPRMVHDPGHPDADADGNVWMPAVNPVDEMTNLMVATRAYEANVRVMNAAKVMALKALEIGGQS